MSNVCVCMCRCELAHTVDTVRAWAMKCDKSTYPPDVISSIKYPIIPPLYMPTVHIAS